MAAIFKRFQKRSSAAVPEDEAEDLGHAFPKVCISRASVDSGTSVVSPTGSDESELFSDQTKSPPDSQRLSMSWMPRASLPRASMKNWISGLVAKRKKSTVNKGFIGISPAPNKGNRPSQTEVQNANSAAQARSTEEDKADAREKENNQDIRNTGDKAAKREVAKRGALQSNKISKGKPQRKARLSMAEPQDPQVLDFRDFEAYIRIQDAEHLNTIKAFIARILALPTIAEMKQKFVDKFLEGKEPTLANRNQANKDIWLFQDLLLYEAWTLANILLEDKLQELDARETKLKESEQKSDKLKASCLKELTLTRDKHLYRDFTTRLIDPLPFLNDSTQALVKNCAEESLRHMIYIAERGEYGKAYDVIRAELTKERQSINDLLNQHRYEFDEELPKLRWEVLSLKTELGEVREDLEEASSELIALRCNQTDDKPQEQCDQKLEETQLGEKRPSGMTLGQGDKTLLERSQTLSPEGSRCSLKSNLSRQSLCLEETRLSRPDLSTPGVHIVGLPVTSTDTKEAGNSEEETINAAAGSVDSALQVLQDFSDAKKEGQACERKEASSHETKEDKAAERQQEKATQDMPDGAFLSNSVMDYLSSIGAVVDFGRREAVFKKITGGQIVKLGDATSGDGNSAVVIDMSSTEHTEGPLSGLSEMLSPSRQKEARARELSGMLDALRQRVSWRPDMSHLPEGLAVGESRPTLPGATSAALMDHATQICALIEPDFGGKGMDLLYALQSLGEKVDEEVLHHAELMCQILEDGELMCHLASFDTYPFTVLLIERINSARSENTVLSTLCIALVQCLGELSEAARVTCPPAQKVKIFSQRISEMFSANHPHLVRCCSIAEKVWMHLDAQRRHLQAQVRDMLQMCGEAPDQSAHPPDQPGLSGPDFSDLDTDIQTADLTRSTEQSGKDIHTADLTRSTEQSGKEKTSEEVRASQLPAPNAEECQMQTKSTSDEAGFDATSPALSVSRSPSANGVGPKARSRQSAARGSKPRPSSALHDEQTVHKVDVDVGVQFRNLNQGLVHKTSSSIRGSELDKSPAAKKGGPQYKPLSFETDKGKQTKAMPLKHGSLGIDPDCAPLAKAAPLKHASLDGSPLAKASPLRLPLKHGNLGSQPEITPLVKAPSPRHNNPSGRPKSSAAITPALAAGEVKTPLCSKARSSTPHRADPPSTPKSAAQSPAAKGRGMTGFVGMNLHIN